MHVRHGLYLHRYFCSLHKATLSGTVIQPITFTEHPMSQAYKRCLHCGKRKAITSFYSRTTVPGDVRPECKTCTKVHRLTMKWLAKVRKKKGARNPL